MKVKELVKFLKECDQNAIVCFDEYIGCDTPTLEVDEVQFYQKGTSHPNYDNSRLVKSKTAQCNLVHLRSK